MRTIILHIFILLCLAGSIVGCSQKETTSTSSPTNTAAPTAPGIAPASGQSSVKPEEHASSVPSFRGLIKNVSLYAVPGRRDDLAISLVVAIANSGAPSVLREWKLDVSSPDKGVPSGLAPVHVNGVVDLPGAEMKTVDLAKEDLMLKTADSPVAAGGQVSGVLTFVLPNTTESQLAHNSTSLVVHFKDLQGRSYWTPKTFIGKKASPL